MSIRTGGEVTRLLAELRDSDSVHREAAAARLRVLGKRAVPGVSALATSDAPLPDRVAALHVLEGIDDSRVVEPALQVLTDSGAIPDAQIAAIAVLRGWLTREPGTRILDALTQVAVDESHAPRLRRASLDALSTLPARVVAPILEQAALVPPAPPSDPSTVLAWLREHEEAPLSELHALISLARERERSSEPADRGAWLSARGAVHAALARRGSTVARYDLRETFDAATAPLPIDFLSAVTAIGDATCLEPMARAWTAAGGDTWWRERLAGAAADIMHRTRLSGRSAVVKRLRLKTPGFI